MSREPSETASETGDDETTVAASSGEEDAGEEVGRRKIPKARGGRKMHAVEEEEEEEDEDEDEDVESILDH